MKPLTELVNEDVHQVSISPTFFACVDELFSLQIEDILYVGTLLGLKILINIFKSLAS